ncbi:hypothetical protein GETHLI_22970 [Geothrix limicola]|uniref:Uncharacterized protein n=1 Tax=Geothrix limicola TaxID=2927978 RepID=A0ABQ5QG22_9BACT|nr:hypothetical protein [Geothrix limicola]GLH73795.1 hypothetical protein GETHLI_22970 [Geothrix limicola]
MSTGPSGPPQAHFEDGLRFLAAALALDLDHRNCAAIVSTACDAIQCFLLVFEAGARRHLPDPEGETARLRGQMEALLTPRQSPEAAARHALEAARLARDQAARLLPLLLD